jgi:hypothetical protein
MIPAKCLTPTEFAKQFPPGGSTGSSRDTRSRNINPGSLTDEHSLSIINDIPTSAKSCLVYDATTLRTYRGDETYPIPQGAEFKQLRELKSLEAVVKQISRGKSVFSHMLVSPEDVVAMFGSEFRKELESIQKDVNLPRG